MQIKKRMANGKKKAITLLSLLAVLASVWFGFTLPKASAADVFAGWSTSGWTISEEGGVAVLLGNSSASLNVLSSDEKVNADGISFDVYIDSVSGTADGNIGAAYRCTSGYQYFFEYNAISKTAKIRRKRHGHCRFGNRFLLACRKEMVFNENDVCERRP